MTLQRTEQLVVLAVTSLLILPIMYAVVHQTDSQAQLLQGFRFVDIHFVLLESRFLPFRLGLSVTVLFVLDLIFRYLQKTTVNSRDCALSLIWVVLFSICSLFVSLFWIILSGFGPPS